MKKKNNDSVFALRERSREVFQQIVDTYVETGEPVGSKTISARLGGKLSSSSIRGIMSDLEVSGLLFAPHTSAGRLPTEAGLRLFVAGLLQVGGLDSAEKKEIEAKCASADKSSRELLENASHALSGLTKQAGLVMAPKTEDPLKHIEFVSLSPGRALVVMVTESGLVENRVIEVPKGLPPSTLIEAGNYLSTKIIGKTLNEAKEIILFELKERRAQLDKLTEKIVKKGLATWSGDQTSGGSLIIRGQANLLKDVKAIDDLKRIRQLFEIFEARREMVKIVELVGSAEGVQIFIGSQHDRFDLAGFSMVVAPLKNRKEQIIGALGVIGPTRINYAKIIPTVDYTSRVVGKFLGQ
ncbi:MAG: heat-inducible transcriptional repressor HrcA [Pseudomonadota bacterium]|nr:heat-inducible transcriptional repressor HrcA [Pseudomonadota bacterium]